MDLHIAQATIHLTLPPSALERTLGFVDGNLIERAVVARPPTTDAITPPAAGEFWPGQGGHYICTQPALLGAPARHLIAGAEQDDVTFGPAIDVPDARSQVDGVANTKALLAASGEHNAAKWAAEYTADGHKDFHLPSRLDLLMGFICAPQLFQKSGWYWSSTQASRHFAFVQAFEGGGSNWSGKGNEHRVRAFRWVHLTA